MRDTSSLQATEARGRSLSLIACGPPRRRRKPAPGLAEPASVALLSTLPVLSAPRMVAVVVASVGAATRAAPFELAPNGSGLNGPPGSEHSR